MFERNGLERLTERSYKKERKKEKKRKENEQGKTGLEGGEMRERQCGIFFQTLTLGYPAVFIIMALPSTHLFSFCWKTRAEQVENVHGFCAVAADGG